MTVDDETLEDLCGFLTLGPSLFWTGPGLVPKSEQLLCATGARRERGGRHADGQTWAPLSGHRQRGQGQGQREDRSELFTATRLWLTREFFPLPFSPSVSQPPAGRVQRVRRVRHDVARSAGWSLRPEGCGDGGHDCLPPCR